MASAPCISSTPTSILHESFQYSLPRRFLLHGPVYNSPPLANPPSSHDSLKHSDNNAFDANVVMVLSVLLCALICSLGLNSIIRCALRCSSFVSSDNANDPNPSARLANTGIKKKALKTFPTISYTCDLKLPGLDTECAICLSDFAIGECVKVLPKCNHGFHVKCIDRWLNSHSSCPTCRHCLIETSKIAGSSQPTSRPDPVQAEPSPEIVIRIEPLQQEGLIRNYET